MVSNFTLPLIFKELPPAETKEQISLSVFWGSFACYRISLFERLNSFLLHVRTFSLPISLPVGARVVSAPWPL